MKRLALLAIVFAACFVRIEAGDKDQPTADLILHHAKVLTVDKKFSIAEAVAIKGDRILAVGDDATVLKLRGKDTKVVDLNGRTVMPGLYDSHLHPLSAATSELNEELPYLQTLNDVFTYIRKKAAELPEGEWIVLRYAFPTRLKDARFPTRKELDEAAP